MAGFYTGRSFVGYRVQDGKSWTWYDDSGGFLAGEMDSDISFEYDGRLEHSLLVEDVTEHLDWLSGRASPFISVYECWEAASHEARRRRAKGRSEVRIYEITVSPRPPGHRERIEYRRVPRLLEDLGVDMPPQVGMNAEHEVLFLQEIPGECVELVPEGEWMGG
jgi:hypothetical protein